MGCPKLLCMAYTVLLFAFGVFLIGIGVYFGYQLIHYGFLVSLNIAPCALIFIFGVMHILTTWLSWKGPSREHLFHIFLFLVIAMLFCAGETVVGVWALVLRGQTAARQLEQLKRSFYGFVHDTYDKNTWVYLQNEMHCCGINNHTDYLLVSNQKGSVPNSCFDSSTTAIYEIGCLDPLVKHVRKTLLNIALVAFGSVAFQIVGAVIFYYYYKILKRESGIRNERRRASRMPPDTLLTRPSVQVDSKAAPSTMSTSS